MEDSPIPLPKWLPVLWLIANCRNGISSWEIHRDLGVTQKTAWFMLQRIRLGMQDDLTGGMLNGEVEIDESFIGGKARNMHRSKRDALKRTGALTAGPGGKTIVLGILERASERSRSGSGQPSFRIAKRPRLRPKYSRRLSRDRQSIPMTSAIAGRWTARTHMKW
jgi:hypothetical protein